ncbi:MAG TPA: sialate O-acetylesterase [Bradyrhizobium sp.]|jgi:hypothetical protein|nr:sialate O-acetylesterase [Bradyrhizobium sp.]
MPDPFVILATGQSNFSMAPALAWTPAANAKLWNFNGSDGNIGTAYAALGNSTVNITQKIASDIGDAWTARPIFLINISFPGEAISHWLLSGGPPPDVYQNILNNISGALSAAGAGKIDLFLWWQGEGDTTPLNTGYVADFATMMSRFWCNSWFPQKTPAIIHSIASTAISGNPEGDHMNDLLLAVVNDDPHRRRYVYTAALSTSTYWDSSNPGHMTGQGYFAAGAMSANTFLYGSGHVSV